MDDWSQRVKLLLDQIYTVDPYYVQNNETRLVNQVSYADIAAGRTSPNSRGSSPFRNPRDEAAPTPLAIQVFRPTAQLSRTNNEIQKQPPVVESVRDNVTQQQPAVKQTETRAKEEQSKVEEVPEQREPEIKIEATRHVSKVDSVDSKSRIQSRRGGSVRKEAATEIRRESRERNPSAETENPVDTSRVLEQRREPMVLRNTLAPKEERRGRSASPIWVPGSTSYADILRGKTSRSPSVETGKDASVVGREIRDTVLEESSVESVQGENVDLKVPRVEVDEELEVSGETSVEESSQQVTVENYPQQQTEVVAEVAPEVTPSAVKSHEKSRETPTSWADESMEEYVLMNEKNYENVTRPVPQQVSEVYNYIHPPLPELVGFIGSQIAYPVSSYVYMPAAPPQPIALPHYTESQISFPTEQYVAQPSYIPEPEIYQQNPLQKPQQKPHQPKYKNPPKNPPVVVQNVEEKCLPSQTPPAVDPPAVDPPVAQSVVQPVAQSVVQPVAQSVVQPAVQPVEVSEPEKPVEQEQPVQQPVTASETATVKQKPATSSESKTFSYAQILSQGLSPKPTPTTSAQPWAATTLALRQVKERSRSPVNSTTSSVHENSPPQEARQVRESSVTKQEARQVRESSVTKQEARQEWDTTRRRETRKTHQDAPKSKIPEKRARRGPEHPREKPQKEKVRGNVEQFRQLEVKEVVGVEESGVSKVVSKIGEAEVQKVEEVRQEREVEVQRQDEKEEKVEVRQRGRSQEKKRKPRKKKTEKSVDDEIDKALKEIEDMDKQKKRDKSREQSKSKEPAAMEKPKEESEKKNAKSSEKKKQG
ncbi:PREDICTED: neurofilament heavy polypeptide-like [Habropoda laboriosa]|nr:PREDICTED: neurofilament heavy polypeptide-like [Habropoda laboriosa]